MLPVVNFAKMFRAAFTPIFLNKNNIKPNFKYKKSFAFKFCAKAAYKLLVKLIPGNHFKTTFQHILPMKAFFTFFSSY